MGVRLDSITFNHDPANFHNNALNIRKNATQTINLPEWQLGVSVNPEDSLAAYTKKETLGNTITIQVQLSSTSATGSERYQIRAVDAVAAPKRPTNCWEWFVYIIQSIFMTLFGNVLGNVKMRYVTLPAGGHTTELFELENLQLWNLGAGIHYTTWNWQYRKKFSLASIGSIFSPWTTFQTTKHKIYLILEEPKEIWRQLPFNASNINLPWTDVLDKSCVWALGAQSTDEAACGVTKNIFDLGPSVITYDCPGGGGTHYTDYSSTFYLTDFLERINGGIGYGEYVNCTDCATFVSTFANIMGCDLWQSQMRQSFQLNPFIAIGASGWYPGCPSWGGTSFNYHEVAWTGGCTENDYIFDGCLQVDQDSDPTSAPHQATYVCNMRFGFPGDMEYRDRLSPNDNPNGSARCNPVPSSRKRRAIV